MSFNKWDAFENAFKIEPKKRGWVRAMSYDLESMSDATSESMHPGQSTVM